MKTLFLSLIISLVFTKIAIKLNILDMPDYRKIHIKATPKAGGIGIFTSVILAQCYGVYMNFHEVHIEVRIVLLVCTIFLFVLGIIDDKRELTAKQKLVAQIIVSIFSVIFGIRFIIFNNIIVDSIISLIWFIGFINALNLIDGLDGLAGGVSLISAIGFYIIGILYPTNYIKLITLSIIGATTGFLFYNWNPAKIFMGDTGSLPMGYLLAAMVILTSNTIGSFGGAVITFVIVLIPIYDTLLSMIRRKINGKSMFAPDRSHFYNLLMDKKGLTHKQTVLFIYLINIILVVLAILLDRIATAPRYIVTILFLIIAFIVTMKADFIKVDE